MLKTEKNHLIRLRASFVSPRPDNVTYYSFQGTEGCYQAPQGPTDFHKVYIKGICKPGTDLEWFNYWRTFCHNWLLGIGLKDENLRLRDHDPEELCFYSKATTDFEFLFPFGWGELWGVADRTDYDLTQHQNTSGKDLTYFDPETNQRYIPYVVEPSLGVERSVLAVLCDAYDEEVVDESKNDVRVGCACTPTALPPTTCVP